MKYWVVEKAMPGSDDWAVASGQCFTKAQADEKLASLRGSGLLLRVRAVQHNPPVSPLLRRDDRPVKASQRKWR